MGAKSGFDVWLEAVWYSRSFGPRPEIRPERFLRWTELKRKLLRTAFCLRRASEDSFRSDP
jgi:hypothetical protein